MRNLLTLLCLCVLGIQYSYQFMAEMNDIMNNCRRDGGYCINTIPPAPPKPRVQPRRRRPARTRKGRRRQNRRGRKPDPHALGAAHSRLPSGRHPPAAAAPAAHAPYQPPAYPPQAAPAYPPQGAPAYPPQAAPGYPPQYPPATTSAPWDLFGGLFGGGGGGVGQPAGPQNAMFAGGMMSMFGLTRKKRQAPAEPMEAAEMPRIRKGQPVMQFLNANCRKAEFDFGCQRQGGFCCLPPL